MTLRNFWLHDQIEMQRELRRDKILIANPVSIFRQVILTLQSWAISRKFKVNSVLTSNPFRYWVNFRKNKLYRDWVTNWHRNINWPRQISRWTDWISHSMFSFSRIEPWCFKMSESWFRSWVKHTLGETFNIFQQAIFFQIACSIIIHLIWSHSLFLDFSAMWTFPPCRHEKIDHEVSNGSIVLVKFDNQDDWSTWSLKKQTSLLVETATHLIGKLSSERRIRKSDLAKFAKQG